MSDKQSITPIEQREIEFHDDRVTAVVADDGTVYVPVRPLCDLIGVTWQGQLERIKRDPVLSDVTIRVSVILTQIEMGRGKNQSREMIALPLDYLNGWLFGINVNRVKESIKEPLIRYQKECYKVLSDAFSMGVAVRPDNEIMQSAEPSAIAFRQLMHMARLTREHYYLTKRVDDHEVRLGVLEAQLSNPDSYVTQEQAQLISGAVKAIATVLGKGSGRNEFGAVYGELYARYGVTSYKHIAAGQFDTVMNWLRSWWAELTDGSNTPF